MSPSDEQRINNILYKIEQISTAQVAVVFLKSIGNRVPKKFATELFEKWGIGQAQKDNGLLILNVMDQRRTEMKVGYGLEGTLPDLLTFRILQNKVVPHFKNGNYGQGMIAAIQQIQTILRDPSVVNEIYADKGVGSNFEENTQHGFLYYFFWVYFVINLLLVLGYGILMLIIDHSKEDYYDKYKRLESYQKTGCFILLFPIPFVIFYSIIKKRLKRYRGAPQFSRENGKKMTLLNAWAENEYLKKEQILEEKIESVEYDVWATDAQNDIMILEYKGENSREYSVCKECGYKTYGRIKSTIIKPATYNQSGKRKILSKCKNCHYEEIKEEVIPQKTRSSSSSSSGTFFSSSSGSSSSWGGGSSGGGGAGVSW